jgi:hypothetical protein
VSRPERSSTSPDAARRTRPVPDQTRRRESTSWVSLFSSLARCSSWCRSALFLFATSSSRPPAWEPLTGIAPQCWRCRPPSAVGSSGWRRPTSSCKVRRSCWQGGGAARHLRTGGCERRRVGHGGCRAAERVPFAARAGLGRLGCSGPLDAAHGVPPCGFGVGRDGRSGAQAHWTLRMACLLAGSGSDGKFGRGLRPTGRCAWRASLRVRGRTGRSVGGSGPLDAAHGVPPFVQRTITASNNYRLRVQHVQLEGGILIESVPVEAPRVGGSWTCCRLHRPVGPEPAPR